VAKIGKKSEEKKLKYIHCGRFNHDVNHYNILHPKKRLALEKEKALEAKIVELKK